MVEHRRLESFGGRMNNWAVFIGGQWHGRVSRGLGECYSYPPMDGMPYTKTGPTQKTSFGEVSIFSTDGADARDQVWIRNDGPGEGLVVVLDGDGV